MIIILPNSIKARMSYSCEGSVENIKISDASLLGYNSLMQQRMMTLILASCF